MIIVITGTPGTGKTTLAKEAAEFLGKGTLVLNDAKLARESGCGKRNYAKELEVGIPELKAAAKKRIAGKNDAILEGHLFCEARFPADIVIVLRAKPETIEKRLRAKRKYAETKMLDNAMAEANGYCLKAARKNYPKGIVAEVCGDKGLKSAKADVIGIVKEFGQKSK